MALPFVVRAVLTIAGTAMSLLPVPLPEKHQTARTERGCAPPSGFHGGFAAMAFSALFSSILPSESY